MEMNRKFVCNECSKKFVNRYNLQRHRKNIHYRGIDGINLKDPPRVINRITMNKFFCDKCNRSFSNDFNLRRHEKDIHINKNPAVFICDICEKSCRTKTEFESHWKINHSTQVITFRRCPVCKSDIKSQDIFNHFNKEHHIKTATQEIMFQNENQFLQWKTNFEKKTFSKFLVGYAKKKGSECVIKKYICHRSGFFQSCSNGFRRLRKQGSKKINGFCPASIHVKKSIKGFQVQLINTHVGHGSYCENSQLNVSLIKKEEFDDDLSKEVNSVAITLETEPEKKTITSKALDSCYFEIVEDIKTETQYEFLPECSGETDNKIGVIEKRSPILFNNNECNFEIKLNEVGKKES